MGFWCGKCQRSFAHNQALIQHLVNAYIHNYCLVCQRDFVTDSALAQHQRTSSNHNICGRCGSDFGDIDDLSEHIEQYHWHCSRCNVFVDSEPMLREHYVESSAHYYCGPCKREFSSASNLSAHLRSAIHVGHTVRCVGCTRLFPTISAMTIHLESGTCVSGVDRQAVNDTIRSRDTDHLITERLLTYPSANGRVDDTWATTAAWNGRAYECYFCPREFRTLPALNQHLKSPVHEQKMYKCPKCATKFTLFSGLVQHVESESCGISRFREVKMTMDRITSALTRMISQ